jgi:hypothetical protein
MARILKGKPLPHAVICDTNILWCEDKAPIANPAFEAFWTKAAAQFDLTLYLPDTVRGELLFQHYTSCHKIFRTTEENLVKISSITNAKHSTRITADKLRAQVEVKFGKWQREKGAEVLQLPIAKIDWARLAQDAIWRNAPFTADAKQPDLEKGFRDALILETVCEFVQSDTRQINIAFLCNDQLLRTTSAGRLKSDNRFTVYESIQEFESYLLLTKEKLTNEFISKILTRARERFYTSNDQTCLYIKEGIRARLQNEFKDYFEDVSKSEENGLLPLGSIFGIGKQYKPSRDGMFWIRKPDFLKVEGDRLYMWKSVVRYVRPYHEEHTPAAFGDLSSASGKVLFLPFQVTWSAKIKNDARFHDLQVVDIKLEGNEFRAPTTEEQKIYDIAGAKAQ